MNTDEQFEKALNKWEKEIDSMNEQEKKERAQRNHLTSEMLDELQICCKKLKIDENIIINEIAKPIIDRLQKITYCQ